MENLEQTSLEIKERFAKVNVQIQEKDITERLSILVNKFRVPINEARRNVTSHFLRVHNINQDVILNRKLTEELTGITLAKAKEIAMESLDAGTVADEMGCKVIGHYFEVTGVQIDKNLIVETIKPFRADVTSQINALLAATEA